jgi:hypothetical protein
MGVGLGRGVDVRAMRVAMVKRMMMVGDELVVVLVLVFFLRKKYVLGKRRRVELQSQTQKKEDRV